MSWMRYRVVLRRFFRNRLVVFSLLCIGLVFLGRTFGLHMASRSSNGSRAQRDTRPGKEKYGALRSVIDSMLPRSYFSEPMEAELNLKVIGNFEPPPNESPRKGVGEHGEPVTLAIWETEAAQRSIRKYSFNQYVSDKISLDRTIPDFRHTQCKHWHYPKQLPEASVIIIFHNEGWSTLLRTVTSIVNRTPPYLLKEIILVDDCSPEEHIHKQLDDYIAASKLNGIAKVVRNQRRLGVIESRMEGTRHALSPVVVFLDAHCEVGVNWLPPLLTVLARNSSTIAVPILDVIDSSSFSLYPQGGGRIARGAFDWNLDYKRIPGLPEREFRTRLHSTQPYRSPTMSGGVFAINKDFFLSIGGYDNGLQMWGGDNLELSFKVWMCGGSLLWVPCSRVGHLYRIDAIPPYTIPGDTFGNYKDRNLARVAEIWMDDYKQFFYINKPYLNEGKVDIGDIKPQLAFRREKQCKSFNWFMHEVAHDLQWHYPVPPLSVHTGEIRGFGSDDCLDTQGKDPAEKGARIGLYKCHGLGGNQLFRLTTAGDIRVNGYCLGQQGFYVILTDCQEEHALKDWRYNQETKLLERRIPRRCLQRMEFKEVHIKMCDKTLMDVQQQWTFSKNIAGEAPL